MSDNVEELQSDTQDERLTILIFPSDPIVRLEYVPLFHCRIFLKVSKRKR